MKKFLSAVAFFLLASVLAIAQTVSGRVTTSTDGAALPGVSVLVKGTTTGLTTDSDGRYTITVPDETSVLVFSFIGFITQEVVVGNRSNINVVMQDDATQLSEVVVTALGIPRETKTLVYATQTVKPSQLTEVRDANNVLNSLQGKIANALITQASGGPGSGARIVLRGNKSIQGSNNALIVVDGVPITNGTNGTITSDFGGLQGTDGASSINPDDIESMTILRGASAAALYGSQAGNGVIVITTKKGTKDRISVSINSGATAERPFVYPAIQNSYGQGNSGVLINTSGENWGPRLDGQSFTGYMGEPRTYSAQKDNIRDFYRTGISLNNSIGVSGGSEKMQTYLSYTNNALQGIMPRNDMDRHTFNLRLTNQVSDRFSTDAKITYLAQKIDSKYQTGEAGPLMELFQIPRNVSLDDAKNFEVLDALGVPEPAPYPVINPALYQNPYWRINRSENNEDRARIMGFVSAKYDITDWLHLNGRANIDKIADELENINYQGTLGYPPTGGGAYFKTNIDVEQKWFDLMLDGSNQIGDNLKIDYRVGGILQDNKYRSLNSNANGLNVANVFSLNFASNPGMSESSTQTRIHSLFGQVNFAFKESIFLDASLRNDWDSRLPSPYSFAYPSVGLSAILSDLFTVPPALSFLKVSGNYAEVGNGGVPQIRFNTFVYEQGAGHGYISRSTTRAIPDLKPEIVKNLEFGLDAKFMENRLGLQVTWYKSNSFNQLLRVNTPPGTGFYDQYINAGNVQNTGVELVLNATPVRSGDFSWDIDFNLGMNRNKVIELTETVKSFNLEGFSRSATPIVKEGGSYGDMLGFKWMKNESGQYLVTDDGKPLSSLTADSLMDIGTFNPKATLGLSNVLNFKNFYVRVLIDGRIGGVIVDGTEQLLSYNGVPEVTEKFREGGWNLGGVDTEGNPVSATISAQDFWTTASGGRYGSAEFFAYDATNFRLREISVGYSIPMSSSFFIKTARLSFVARNVFWLYRGKSLLDIPGIGKRKMSFDPDMSLGNSNWQGVSYGTSPSTRSIGLNLQLTF
ncbi:MAG: SusC/RagA family TonB-linked outer membrane protein [Chryseosolibacter sp.]